MVVVFDANVVPHSVQSVMKTRQEMGFALQSLHLVEAGDRTAAVASHRSQSMIHTRLLGAGFSALPVRSYLARFTHR